MIFLVSFGKALTVVHVLAAMVMLGAVTHQVVVARRALRGALNPRLARIYGLAGLVACAGTTALGALIYPTYRYHVRGQYLDHCAVGMSKLFDVKEDFAVFALLVATAVWLAARGLERRSPREHLWIYAGSTYALAGLVWFNSLSGFVITLTRGVP
jgi:hypothetical protein